MLQTLARPLSFHALLALSVALLAANTIYCLIYTSLSGRPESLSQALGWSVANLLPWLWAFEAGKRWNAPVLAVLGGAAVSLLLGILLLDAEANLFELARRLPGAAIILGTLLALRRRELRVAGERVELPLAPDQIA